MSKPIGQQYEIDWSHPLAEGLSCAILPTVTGEEDLVGTWGVQKLGQEVIRDSLSLNGASKTSTDCGYRLTPPSGFSKDILNKPFTFFANVELGTQWDADGRGTFFDSRNSSGNTGYLFFLNGSELVLQIDKGQSVEDVFKISNYFSPNSDHSIVISVDPDAGVAHLAANNVIQSTVFTAGDWERLENTFISTLRRGLVSGTSLDNLKGYSKLVGFYERALSLDETYRLQQDPYQFLKLVKTVRNSASIFRQDNAIDDTADVTATAQMTGSVLDNDSHTCSGITREPFITSSGFTFITSDDEHLKTQGQ